jgi:hypothetical protein
MIQGKATIKDRFRKRAPMKCANQNATNPAGRALKPMQEKKQNSFCNLLSYFFVYCTGHIISGYACIKRS